MILCVGVAALNSTLAFLVPPLRDLQAPLLANLFSCEALEFAAPVKGLPVDTGFWGNTPHLLALCIAIAVKLVMTILALSLPLPNGCIAPVYVLGALLGRAFGTATGLAGGLLGFWEAGSTAPAQIVLPSHFAMVGAAAFSASVCRSFSMAVAIYELVPLASMELPIGVATIVSILVANNHGPSIFDAILSAKKLPAPLQFRSFRYSLLPVDSVMRRDVPTVHRFSGLADLDDAVSRCSKTGFVAVVNTPGKLCGAITKYQLLQVKKWLESATEEEAKAAIEKRSSFGNIFAGQSDDVPERPHGKLVDLCQENIIGEKHSHMDVMPLQVPPKTTLQDVAVLFILHSCEVAFVTEESSTLRGMVLAQDLQQLHQ